MLVRSPDAILKAGISSLARKSALTYKAKDNSIAILEDFNFDSPKTKQFVALLKALSLSNKKTLLVLPEAVKNVVLSGRNIQRSKITTADQINTFDLMNADNIIFVESAISKVENLLNKE